MNDILISSLAFLGISKYRKIKDLNKELKDSNYGREYGWWIELNGKVLGELVKVKQEDMFWDSYEIKSIKPEHVKQLFDSDLWDNHKFIFRNKKFNKYAKSPFPAGLGKHINLGQGNRISMRGLYLLKP